MNINVPSINKDNSSKDIIPTTKFSNLSKLNADLIPDVGVGNSNLDSTCVTYTGLSLGNYYYGETVVEMK